jgi:hypothetical protein
LRTTVVNLAGPGDGPASYVATLRDYQSLDGDIICLLDDPARTEGSGVPWRHQSALFRRTGYFPLLTRLSSLEAARAPISGKAPSAGAGSAAFDCGGNLRPYCDPLASTIDYGVSRGMRVMVVRPPAVTAGQRAREDAASQLLQARFGGRADVRLVDLSREEELSAAARDAGRGLTAGESDRLADLMTTPMLELMRR